MTTIGQIAAVIAILANGVIYGTEVFAAIVQRSALAHVDDASLTRVMGYIHLYAGKRLAAPGMIGLVGVVAATVLAIIGGTTVSWIAGVVSLVALLSWFIMFNKITVPLDRQFATAAVNNEDLPDARALQRRWDRVIGPQALFQAISLAGICVLVVTIA